MKKMWIIITLLLIASMTLFLWPMLNGCWIEADSSIAAEKFITHRATPEIPYVALRNAMQRYNTELYQNAQAGMTDPWAYEAAAFDLPDYGIDNGVLGVIEIPQICVALPVYLGATKENLTKGVAVLGQTSMPIGGINTNCVISGHRGYQGADFFRYVPDLEIGDRVNIINLWDVLEYKVVAKQIIEPSDIKEILIQPDKDMLTLLTCHPYAGGGRQRYVVYCERIGTE